MDGSINLVGQQMCEECDAFLGKPHKDTCSKKGRLVEMADATEKFTTVEHANKEHPMLGIDVETAVLIVDRLSTHESDPDHEKVYDLVEALKRFIEEAENV